MGSSEAPCSLTVRPADAVFCFCQTALLAAITHALAPARTNSSVADPLSRRISLLWFWRCNKIAERILQLLSHPAIIILLPVLEDSPAAGRLSSVPLRSGP